ncbi:hypothetical protein A1QO_02785 [Vibrio genomosp. F10 str. ZF-129]|uniref:Uncharacterized protein n=1 Tax=Vibrio genomosp. F10 str. ZF-129 TaxID=1187848 RepID=A0A1E5BKE2_9VIBR|nr:hypothetical protein [Vibrio genomosp. F10]OEE38322.1 hypothetical protein A1QO_02785 [Vibrio genomosp. F10 str. ZF-129]
MSNTIRFNFKSLMICLASIGLCFSSVTLANEPSCHFDGKEILLNESIYIHDHYLESKFFEYHKDKGFSDDEIKKKLEYSDWTGHLFKCVRTFGINPDYDKSEALINKLAAERFIVTGAALTPVSHQVDWIEKQKGLTRTERQPYYGHDHVYK